MKTIVRIKNYRCFVDSNPIEFELSDGFTAIVGPNNIGKSTLLKLFFEMRPLFQAIQTGEGLVSLHTQRTTVNLNALEVPDISSVFSNKNDRGVILEFEFPDVPYGKGKIVELKADRPPNGFWRIRIDSINPGSLSREGHLAKFGQFSLEHITTLFENLSRILYVGPFRSAIHLKGGPYYDLQIGADFVKIWKQWKTGHIKSQNKAVYRVTEDIRNLFKFQSLEINPSDNTESMVLYVDGNPYKLDEMGAGIAEFILVLANAAIKQPTFIFIDEPEIHLHPGMQITFLSSLAKYSVNGVVFATHSVGLARSLADRTYSLKMQGEIRKFEPLGSVQNYSQFLGEMSYSSFQEVGYEAILLVEGVTDVKVLQYFLRQLRKDAKLILVPLGGNALINPTAEQELCELLRIAPKMYALIDSERSAADTVPPERTKFVELCGKVGIKAHLTERRATENYFTDSAVKETYGPNYRALSEYEHRDSLKNKWPKSDNWKIASRMNVEDIMSTDLGEFLSSL